MAYIGRQLARGENKLFDDISSSFNGSTTVFNLTVSSVATATATPYQLFVSLGGVMQKPNTDFTTAGNQITFTTAPAAGLSCWIMMQGDTIDQAAIPDASVTPSKISGSNFAFSGDLRLKDADGSHYVGFASPSTVTTNKVWTLPAADGGASTFLQTNGSGVLSWSGVGGASGIDFNDNVKARWGTGNDLQIFHNANHSKIVNLTGDLRLNSNSIQLKNYDEDETFLTCTDDGAVDLYHNNVKKFETSAAGVSITGALTVSTNATITGNLTVNGTTTTVDSVTLSVKDKNIEMGVVSSPSDTTADGGGLTLKGASDKTFNWVNATDAWTSSEHIHVLDNKNLLVGTGSDLSIYHDGTDSIISNATNVLKTHSSHLFIRNAAGNEDIAKFVQDGAVELYHNNSKKLETTSGGINVTGAINVNGSALSTAPQITATASGAITAGDRVIINTNGTVTKAQASFTEITTAIGNELEFQGYDILGLQVCYNPVDDYYFLVWVNIQGGGTAHILRCRVATVNAAGGITFGTDVFVNPSNSTNNTDQPSISYDASANKFLVCWRNVTESNRLYAAVVSVSGTTCSSGTRVEMSTDNVDQIASEYDPDNNKHLVCFRNNTQAGLKGKARVATISGTNVSFGSEVEIDGNNQLKYMALAYDTGNNKFLVAYRNEDDSDKLEAKTATISGTSVSFGTSIDVTSAAVYGGLNLSYDPTAGRGLLIARDGNVKAYVLTISGTNVSASSAISVFSGNTTYNTLAYNPALKVCGFFYSSVSGNYPRYRKLTIASATSVTIGAEVTLGGWGLDGTNQFGDEPYGMFGDFSNDGQFLFAYRRASDSDGYAIAVTTASEGTNLTKENYIGIAAASASDSASATIDVAGATNSNQSSLTAGQHYYVQNNGSLGLSPASPAIFAGTAVSATKLVLNATAPVVTPYGELIETKSLEGLQGHAFETLDWDTYLEYVIHLSNIRFVYSSGSGTNLAEHLNFRIKTTGSYLTSRYSYNQVRYRSGSSSQTTYNDSNYGQWQLASQVHRILHARLHFPRSAAAAGGNVNTDAGFCQSVHGDAQCNEDGGGSYSGQFFKLDGGMHSHADCQGTTTGIQFLASSNMYIAAKGEARLYGIRG